MKTAARLLDKYGAATARFLLIVAAVVCFTLAALGISPHPTQDDSLGWLGAAFLSVAALFFDPDNPPNERLP